MPSRFASIKDYCSLDLLKIIGKAFYSDKWEASNEWLSWCQKDTYGAFCRVCLKTFGID